MHTVIETPVFNRSADQAGMTETERFGLITILASTPEAGDLIVGSGGCRKVRLARTGAGKSGGYRVITFFAGERGVILLMAFAKSSAANLTDAQVNALAKAVKAIPTSF